ncbi:OprD family porin [Acinetobacter sp. V89_7]|uniref:OprD family porin n=1 Tax=Acinetobacter sp. V89_7 TaxID=3044233 RepID=UPI00249F10AE|nr:OprD family porin [Acinetobacter sp. V89_7]MDI3377729.1 OprD family porin [Acinetobacter sp. V89_7]
MLKAQKLTLAVVINAVLITSAYASEQSDAKGFVEGAQGSVLLRNGFIQRDKKKGLKDTNSWVQSAMLNLESGFTQGPIGFAAGVVGDFSFKLGDNKNSGNSMVPRDSNGNPYDQWTRGGGFVKARASNTALTYGTQVLDLPVLASMTTRNTPEYFEGTLITSHEIKDLELVAGKFTKNQLPEHIATDQNHLDRAYVWGAKYKFNDQLNASYYGADIKDKIERHYVSAAYKQPLANDSSLSYEWAGYSTKFKPGADTYFSGGPNTRTEDLNNYIWAFSTTYSQGAHSVMGAYQQNTGGIGYDYGANQDGGQSIYLPNSYLSDFNSKGEKSVQLQYNLDLGAYNVPGLKWTTAFVYGWDIDVIGTNIDNANEREFFNQLSYTVQSGFAKDLKIRARYSILRQSDVGANTYGDTNETRIFIDFPIKFL